MNLRMGAKQAIAATKQKREIHQSPWLNARKDAQPKISARIVRIRRMDQSLG
jgi:hypothetical protein